MATIDQTTANTTRRTKSSSSTHYEMHTLSYITLGLGALKAWRHVLFWHKADMLNVICIATPSFADQVVRATWYGNELRGHRTASGEMFNPGGMTAAHKSLPFGTCLVIGNPKTGRKVALRVNDRGPFTPGVMLDLSSGAAEAIGMRSTQSVTMSRC